MQVSIADPQTSTTTTTTRSKWSRFFSFLQARGRRDTTTTASAAKQDNTVSNTKPNKKQEQRQESNDHDNIQCFIVNYDAVQNENAVAEIYCTSDVEEFAWYHGLSVDELVNTEDMPSLALDFSECVQGASHRGTPEWECKPEATDSKNDDEGDNKKDWSNFGIWESCGFLAALVILKNVQILKQKAKIQELAYFETETKKNIVDPNQ